MPGLFYAQELMIPRVSSGWRTDVEWSWVNRNNMTGGICGDVSKTVVTHRKTKERWKHRLVKELFLVVVLLGRLQKMP